MILAHLISIVVGAIVGWLASLLVKGSGSAMLMDVLGGIGGSVIARFLLPALGLTLSGGIIGAIVPSVIGAVVLLLIVKLIRRAGCWRELASPTILKPRGPCSDVGSRSFAA